MNLFSPRHSDNEVMLDTVFLYCSNLSSSRVQYSVKVFFRLWSRSLDASLNVSTCNIQCIFVQTRTVSNSELYRYFCVLDIIKLNSEIRISAAEFITDLY